MKKSVLLILALFALHASAAQAASLLLDQQADRDQYFGDAKYELNPELGRARLQVTYLVYHEPPAYGPSMPDHIPETAPLSVPGLSYDAASHAVVFAGAKGRVVCATTAEKHSVWGDKLLISPTGKCVTRSTKALVKVDDGFNVRQERVVQTWFDVQE